MTGIAVQDFWTRPAAFPAGRGLLPFETRCVVDSNKPENPSFSVFRILRGASGRVTLAARVKSLDERVLRDAVLQHSVIPAANPTVRDPASACVDSSFRGTGAA